MIQVNLTQIKTKDNISLDGVVIDARRKDVALVWLHGLTSKFYGDQSLMSVLSEACTKNNIGYFKFNTRGRDMIYRNGENYLGAGFESFSDCIEDIRAMIRLAKKLGYKRIILAGHSTGANKALYYIYKTQDRAVKGLILAGPICDRSAAIKQFGVKKVDAGLVLAEQLKKKKIKMMPIEYGIMSPDRYISLNKPGTAEDVFPYYNPQSSWKELSSIKVPVLVAIGAKDEYLDRPAKEFVTIFRTHALSTKSFSGAIIKGTGHDFEKKEELTVTILHWITTL